MVAEAVRPQSVGAGVVARLARLDDDEQQRGGGDRADHLGDPVAHGVAGVDLAPDEEPQRDCRVDVTARDRTDRVRHHQQRQAERKRDSEVADLLAGDHRRADAAEDQHEGPDNFS
jgi:hypothetical protein